MNARRGEIVRALARRRFLAGVAAGATLLGARSVRAALQGKRLRVEPGPPDANGIRLLPGFTARVVARADEAPVAGAMPWPRAPDGGATFAHGDGGWSYVSNSEVDLGAGGAGALRFDAAGNVVGATRVLAGTSRNCAGGATPWGTWLSCEEIPFGRVWECDPEGVLAAVVHPALGSFNHEAVAVDPQRGRLYLTEDQPDGRLYRFTPAAYPSLAVGLLEVAEVLGDPVTAAAAVLWRAIAIANPGPADPPTRYQVSASTPFNGGEGIAWHDGAIYFATKGDNRVWCLDCTADTLRVLYDDAWFAAPVLTGVDNVLVGADGVVYVAEDGGDMQLVGLGPDGTPFVLLQVTGQAGSEITGPAFSPDGTRLYFSSQRAAVASGAHGITYEVRGPFVDAPGIAATIFADGYE